MTTVKSFSELNSREQNALVVVSQHKDFLIGALNATLKVPGSYVSSKVFSNNPSVKNQLGVDVDVIVLGLTTAIHNSFFVGIEQKKKIGLRLIANGGGVRWVDTFEIGEAGSVQRRTRKSKDVETAQAVVVTTTIDNEPPTDQAADEEGEEREPQKSNITTTDSPSVCLDYPDINTDNATSEDRVLSAEDLKTKKREAFLDRIQGVVKGPRRDPIQKSKDKPNSLRLAINAKCWDCMGGGSDPGIRQRIRDCDSTYASGRGCSLNAVRPYQHGADEDENDMEASAETSEEATGTVEVADILPIASVEEEQIAV